MIECRAGVPDDEGRDRARERLRVLREEADRLRAERPDYPDSAEQREELAETTAAMAQWQWEAIAGSGDG
jgi:hypothetical protein